MKFNRNPAFWTSTILHLVVFSSLFLVTLIEAFLPKEQAHVFEMISEPAPDDNAQRNSSIEPMPDFELPDVKPLEIPEPVVSKPEPIEKPVDSPVQPKEQLMSYADFIKENPVKTPKPRTLKPSKPNVTVPKINTERFSANLVSRLMTVEEGASSALTAAERTALQRYGDQLNQRLNQAWIKPDDLSGLTLVVTVVFDVSSSGRISNIQLRPGSGNASFDASVKAAFARVGSGGATPTGQKHTFTMTFKMLD